MVNERPANGSLSGQGRRRIVSGFNNLLRPEGIKSTFAFTSFSPWLRRNPSNLSLQKWFDDLDPETSDWVRFSAGGTIIEPTSPP